MEDANKLKNMELHEIFDFGPCTVMRVNGGWIYYAPHGNVFVPLSDEFLSKQS